MNPFGFNFCSVASRPSSAHDHIFSAFKCSNPGLSDDLRRMFLNFHNDARRRVAKGIEPNKVGKLNPAKNMYKLVITCSISKEMHSAKPIHAVANRSTLNLVLLVGRYKLSGNIALGMGLCNGETGAG